MSFKNDNNKIHQENILSRYSLHDNKNGNVMVSNNWFSGDSWIIFSSLPSTADWIFAKSFSLDALRSPNKSLKYVLFPQFLINSQCVTASKMDKSIHTSKFFKYFTHQIYETLNSLAPKKLVKNQICQSSKMQDVLPNKTMVISQNAICILPRY